MPPSHLLHGLHHQLVVVHGNVGRLVDRRQLMLGRGHLVVLGPGRDAQLPQLHVQILHIRAHPLADGAEIVILQLLSLGCRRAEQGAPREDQVFPLQIPLSVHQEILLLRPNAGHHLGGARVAEQPDDAQRLLADCLHGTEQRCLLIQGLPRVGAECGGDAENDSRGVFFQKCRGSDVPGGVAPGFEGGPKPAGREGGSVRLAFDQLLARKLHDHLAVFVRMGHESVMLLRCDAGQRLEPVGIMGGTVLHRPVLHGLRHHVGRRQGQLPALVHDLPDLLVDAFGKPFLHLAESEHLAGKQLFYVQYFAHFPSPFCLPPSPPAAAGSPDRPIRRTKKGPK